MRESLLTALSIENEFPSTLLTMEPSGIPPAFSPFSHDDSDCEPMILSFPPDINITLGAEHFPSPLITDARDNLDVSLRPPINEPEISSKTGSRKLDKRGDSIWGAWFFFSFYFKPVLAEKSKGKVTRDGNGFSGFNRSDLRLELFLVQHDMENMYMWVFKERPENALGKMQLRSYMNGHSRPGLPPYPFCAEKGFVRSHRMQRKQYRGLSNPLCVHGIDVVRSPNLMLISEVDRKKWMELTGRDLCFSIPLQASDFGSWRNLPNVDFELERVLPSTTKNNLHPHPKNLLSGSDLNLSVQPSIQVGEDGMSLSSMCGKRRKDSPPYRMDEDCYFPANSCSERVHDIDIHPIKPSWLNVFTGVMREAYGPVTAAKTIYEDQKGYLIMISLPFSDQSRMKVSWRNDLTHGIITVTCISTARPPYIKRCDRIFKLTDPSPEHCPPGKFVREIPLATRIPEDAKLEAYYDESGSVLEIMVPKHHVGPEEHEVHVCLRPHLGANELMLTREGKD